MLPLDLWQFCVIDYLEYKDQSKLVKLISGLQLTNLIGMKGLTDTKLQKFKFVKFLHAGCNNKITNEGIKHMNLHTLYARYNENITDKGIEHMTLHTLYANNKITNEGIKHVNLNALYVNWNSNITNEGTKHSVQSLERFISHNML
jgi:hypothetical protein